MLKIIGIILFKKMKKIILIILLFLSTISNSYALSFKFNGVSGNLDLIEDDHTNLSGIGTNTHPQIDTHIDDTTIHFTEGSIDHTNILSIGTNTHPQIDTHIADTTIHFTVGSIDHGSIAGLADDDHTQYILENGTRAFSGNQSFGDLNITNVGDISLDTISSDAGTSVSVTLGTDAGDDFIVGNNNVLVVTGDNDRVGIGTNTPTTDLHIFKASSSAFMDLERGDGATFTMVGGFLNGFLGTRSNHPMAIGTNNTENMRILTNGDIGFGTDTPLNHLHIKKATATTQRIEWTNNTSFGSLVFYEGATAMSGFQSIGSNFSTTNRRSNLEFLAFHNNIGNITFATRTGGTLPERMRISNSGRIGINESSPDAMLEIVTNSTTEEGLKVKGSASQTGSLFNLTDSSDNIYITSGDGLTGSEFRGNDQQVDIDLVWEGANVDEVLKVDAGLDALISGANAIWKPSSVANITAGGGITVTNEFMKIQGSGGAVDITANPQIAAGTDGQQVTIMGQSDTNTVTLDDGTGLYLTAQAVLGDKDVVTLRYDSTDSEWQEINRN